MPDDIAKATIALRKRASFMAFKSCGPQIRRVTALRNGPLAATSSIGEENAPIMRRIGAGGVKMAGVVEKKLADLGIVLPTPASPLANYVGFVRTGNLLVVSGQLCLDAEGKLVAKGKLGADVTIEDGQKAARACAINVLAQVKAALGDLDKVSRVVRLGGFISSVPAFLDGPKVMNGASDMMVTAFADKGRHARSTIGVSVLPLDAAVEVEGMFEVS
jgi:enamine deaminase RidA (YjgF/YER057c/UK114 family)